MNIQEAGELIQGLRLPAAAPLRWADLGCGGGTFTYALHDMLPPDSIIYAIDKNQQQFDEPGIRFSRLDFEEQPLQLPPLSGILMANSLHYIKDQLSLLKRLRLQLEEGGTMAIVEYDTSNANRWVPFPVPPAKAAQLAEQCGYRNFYLMGSRPSVYHSSGMYAAAFSA
ncbi:class I SAM-dependent methyltransferase [Niabella beijingensis]|uniref:class I SAM-dependent methyltransferase n=1 Tax=Niabella beijingensis TaxID=2872700 RepID=UPI001CBC8374|nr:methyltransferase domain-containing protein [Niabella beijingensis]MBZ4188576.1 class I SAM-dependent methyltransferase [Niabella beijingensis]